LEEVAQGITPWVHPVAVNHKAVRIFTQMDSFAVAVLPLGPLG
jgi:hypothetical protein